MSVAAHPSCPKCGGKSLAAVCLDCAAQAAAGGRATHVIEDVPISVFGSRCVACRDDTESYAVLCRICGHVAFDQIKVRRR